MKAIIILVLLMLGQSSLGRPLSLNVNTLEGKVRYSVGGVQVSAMQLEKLLSDFTKGDILDELVVIVGKEVRVAQLDEIVNIVNKFKIKEATLACIDGPILQIAPSSKLSVNEEKQLSVPLRDGK